MKKFTVNTRRVQISFISLITITLLLFIGCCNADLLDTNPPNDIQTETNNEQNMDELFLQELQKLLLQSEVVNGLENHRILLLVPVEFL